MLTIAVLGPTELRIDEALVLVPGGKTTELLVRLAPAAVVFGQMAHGKFGRWLVGVGVAAATVQVIGLYRWVLFVPGLSDDAQNPAQRARAEDQFETLHTWLGTILGETIGYALTATFTVLAIVAVTRRGSPAWVTYLGYAAAGLIATGVVIPLGIETASLTNFVGYVAWCLWLIAAAVILWRTKPSTHTPTLVTTPAADTAA